MLHTDAHRTALGVQMLSSFYKVTWHDEGGAAKELPSALLNGTRGGNVYHLLFNFFATGPRQSVSKGNQMIS